MNSQGGVAEFLDKLRALTGVRICAPAPAREVDRVEAFAGTRLPPAHRALLLAANGLSSSWGFDRIYGVGDAAQDIGPWNAHETWKFAWGDGLCQFLAFAGSGWGDQFAYRLADLRRGHESIWMLDRFMMQPTDGPVAATFESFLAEFLGRASEPSAEVVEARRQVGDLGPDKLAVFSPSPLIVGFERATQLHKMPARNAMTTNGDMARQLLDPANETRKVARFESFADERGRLRVRVRWATPGHVDLIAD